MTARVKLVQEVRTPSAVYSVVFSSDGERLFYGGGWWYGGAYISFLRDGGAEPASESGGNLMDSVIDDVADTVLRSSWINSGRRKEARSSRNNFLAIAVSGLCLDASDRYLAVTVWMFGHEYYPSLLFSIEEEGLVLRRIYIDDTHDGLDLGPATGVRIHDGKLWVRRSNGLWQHTFSWFALPSEAGSEGLAHHLTSARMTCLGEGSGSLLVSGQTTRNAGVSKPWLVSAARHGREEQLRRSPGVDNSTLTAITRDSTGSTLMTGTSTGLLTAWTVSNREGSLPEIHQGPSFPAHETEIKALCTFGSDDFIASADQSGTIRIWKQDRMVSEWKVPRGRPYTMAAHPTLPRLAIGCKNKGGGEESGPLYIYDVHL